MWSQYSQGGRGLNAPRVGVVLFHSSFTIVSHVINKVVGINWNQQHLEPLCVDEVSQLCTLVAITTHGLTPALVQTQ